MIRRTREHALQSGPGCNGSPRRCEPPVDRHRDSAKVVRCEGRLEELSAVVREKAHRRRHRFAFLQSARQFGRAGSHLPIRDDLVAEDTERLCRRAIGWCARTPHQLMSAAIDSAFITSPAPESVTALWSYTRLRLTTRAGSGQGDPRSGLASSPRIQPIRTAPTSALAPISRSSTRRVTRQHSTRSEVDLRASSTANARNPSSSPSMAWRPRAVSRWCSRQTSWWRRPGRPSRSPR